jgi:uncharacterized protein (DUF362 family)
MRFDRRDLLAGASAVAAGAIASVPSVLPKYRCDRRKPRSGVAILHADDYSHKLERILLDGLRLFPLNLKSKRVLLKPNLVEYVAGKEINTNPRLVGAAAACFLALGAQSVIVAEGPGHHRDTELISSESGLTYEIRERGVEFVDLNRDELVKTRHAVNYTSLNHLWLPKTVLASNFIVSMPKLKTHHWAGVTLSMKNMFGVVPGLKYGWPKNILHWQGVHESILDICATVPVQFVIADGIFAMEGNGPLHGGPRRLGSIILADDPVAADATCARLMGLLPERVPHIYEAGKFLGNVSYSRIDQVGEPLSPPSLPFQLLPEFHHLVAPSVR